MNWDNTHNKMKKFFDEGMKLFKEGMKEAEHIGGVAVDATKLHIKKEKDKLQKEKEFYKLGKLFYSAYNTRTQEVELTDDMKTAANKIHRLMDEENEIDSKLSKFSVVKESKKQKK